MFCIAILFKNERKCYFPLAKLNYGVYYTQSLVSNSNIDGANIKTPSVNFHSYINHEAKAIKNTPNEKLICSKIIIR